MGFPLVGLTFVLFFCGSYEKKTIGGGLFFHQDCSQKSNLKVLEGSKIEAARKQKHMVFQAQNRNKMRKRNFF